MSKENLLKTSTETFSGNSVYIAEMYRKYLQNPASVDEDWQEYFSSIGDELADLIDDYDGASWKKRDLKILGIANIEAEQPKKKGKKITKKDESLEESSLNYKVARLINRFRRYGHLISNLDPLNLTQKDFPEVLSTEFHLITAEDLSKKIILDFEPDFSGKTVEDIINKLHKIYSSTISYEYEYISNIEEKVWLRRKLEDDSSYNISNDDKISALNNLHRAVSFEQMLHKKFPGAKRFSVEGGEAIIPALEKFISLSGENKIENIEIGMAHRGRLNVLTNICEKPYENMIAEFKGACGIPEKYQASGDVKYHMGYSCDRDFSGHNLHIALAYNPSHLEAVNSVVAGKSRAKQDSSNDEKGEKTIPILIHGDAAFMGQGCVPELLNMAYVDAYSVGGTVHFVINNQIGFTARKVDSRSTQYSSDIAKVIEAPIIHVNGEDVDAVIYAVETAFEYRQKFNKDIVIDIVCYRKYGHNEGDEPNYTNPIMYSVIKKLKSLDEIYAKQLENAKIFSNDEYLAIKSTRSQILEEAFKKSDSFKATDFQAYSGKWKNLAPKYSAKNLEPKTGVKNALELANKILTIPEDFNTNSKLKKQLSAKKEIVNKEQTIDWALGESLAYASLLTDDYAVRITGQDAKRGTFSHRHSVLRDAITEEEYIPLNHLDSKEKYMVADSVLSEYAVLGFEYGYSLTEPNCLTIWEGQFGDFANGAQIMFDQFIASGETKWLRASGITLLLPHGYEGQGPEHSSARLERYLQACAEDNIQVANCTTPANFFHILRRQMLRDFRKPLMVMTPKSLLRHKLVHSNIAEISGDTKFQAIITETEKLTASDKIRKVILCSGKIYYDLLDERQKRNIDNIALLRIEELYPFPEKEIIEALKNYKEAEILWCQEESENMGAWNFIDRRLEQAINKAKIKATRPQFVGRIASASPATGYMSVHLQEQKEIFAKAFG